MSHASLAASRPSGRGRLRAAAARPADIVEATRWLFALLTLVSLLLTLPGPLSVASPTSLLLTGASSVFLALSWITGYLRRRVSLAMDVVDAVAILGFALASPSPTSALSFLFPALWFRSLYGSTSLAVLRCALYAAALGACVPLWTLLTGHESGIAVAPLVGVVPTMFLTVVVGRHLAASIRARAEAAERDAVHVWLGSELLGVTDVAAIKRAGWSGASTICSATTGLRLLRVARDGDLLRVEAASGDFPDLPAQVPVVPGPDGSGWVPGQAELDAATGARCTWVQIALPQVNGQPDDRWFLVGSPGAGSVEAISSIKSLVNQVDLALRNSEVHRELTMQATLDSLTHLANRAAFNTAVSAALSDRRAHHVAVLFVDLDDFKDVNDVFGHAAGDALLREVAGRLLRTARSNDVCSRLGGDEFAVLLPDTTESEAAAIAQRIVFALGAPVHLSAGVARVGASVGVAMATDETDLDQVVHNADVAMYAAKASGKGRVQIFEPGLFQPDSSLVTFERELAVAAARDELVVHYQPIISLGSGRCTAVEALVRWQHPTRGLLFPDAFIAVAERCGAVVDIGAWVMRRACADARDWHDAHPSASLAVHVNVSALQLDDEPFVDMVKRCLDDFKIAPRKLVLEITETAVIASPAAIARLEELAAHGVVVAIDDFGTGYSALTTLRALPVGIVKIDKSFVDGSTANSQDRAVTEAVVTMAAHLGLRTIAEGVERLDQLAFLEGIGADAVQGFLYQRPSSSHDFSIWLGGHLAALPLPAADGDVVVPFVPRQIA